MAPVVALLLLLLLLLFLLALALLLALPLSYLLLAQRVAAEQVDGGAKVLVAVAQVAVLQDDSGADVRVGLVEVGRRVKGKDHGALSVGCEGPPVRVLQLVRVAVLAGHALALPNLVWVVTAARDARRRRIGARRSCEKTSSSRQD